MSEMAALFELAHDDEPVETCLTVPLAQRYGLPPFSIIDRRAGYWVGRKRKWNALGLRSAEGREDDLLGAGLKVMRDSGDYKGFETLSATSIFDPALAEILYEWFSAPGQRVIDPFAGGSVRGIVGSRLRRHYTGIDLSRTQIEANRVQAHLGDPDYPVHWINGDSLTELPKLPAGEFDFCISCPPYYDLEVYSDGPADLSTMPYDRFLEAYAGIICETVDRLRTNSFACWVISDVRDKTGAYRGLVADTISLFQAAGADLWNDLIVLDPVGSVAVRAARPFDGSRKVGRLHQHALVFCKGSAKAAAAELNRLIEASETVTGVGDATLF